MCPRLPRASMGHVVLLPQAADVCLPSVYPEQGRVTPLESTLVELLILSTLNPFRMNTCRAKPHFAQFWCNISPFRINTCKSVSKQTTLSTFRINTYKKTGGWGRGIPSNRPIPSPPILRRLFQVPYPVSPLLATLTKTPGVYTQNPQFGTHCSPLATRHSPLDRRGFVLLTDRLRPPARGSHRFIHIAVGLFAGITLALIAALKVLKVILQN